MTKWMKNELPRDNSSEGGKHSGEFGDHQRTGGLKEGSGGRGDFTIMCEGTAEQKAKAVKAGRMMKGDY